MRFIALALMLGAPALAQPVTYEDARGNAIEFPLGAASFADEVWSQETGTKAPKGASAVPAEALGEPDFVSVSKGAFATLGCEGTLVLRFTDNALVDVEGPDLFVFEVGPDIEATELAISGDGIDWTPIGRIEGATAAIDISGVAGPGDSYSYVRLTDVRSGCGSRFPGADIDAVGAIGAGTRIVLDAAVLFDVDSAALKSEAESALYRLLGQIETAAPFRVVVEGHTDADGSDEYNLHLSRARAQSVSDWLIAAGGSAGLGEGGVETVGYGESRPAAPNEDEAGKALNRRVEILLIAR